MVTETIIMEIPEELYENADAVFKKYGLNVEEACVIILEESVGRGEIPFDYSQDGLIITIE